MMEGNLEMNFKEKEMKYLDLHNDNALVIFVKMISTRVKRVMINTSNSVNIIYFDNFYKFRLSNNDITHITSSLMGFTDDSILPLGTMKQHITFGDKPYSKMILAKFMMVDIISAYNTIIG